MSFADKQDSIKPITNFKSKSIISRYDKNKESPQNRKNDSTMKKSQLNNSILIRKRTSQLIMEELYDLRKKEKILKEKLIISLSDSNDDLNFLNGLSLQPETIDKAYERDMSLACAVPKKINSTTNLYRKFRFSQDNKGINQDQLYTPSFFSRQKPNDNYDAASFFNKYENIKEASSRTFQSKDLDIKLKRQKSSIFNEKLNPISSMKSLFSNNIILLPENNEKIIIEQPIVIKDESKNLKKKLLFEKNVNFKPLNIIEDQDTHNHETLNRHNRILKKINTIKKSNSIDEDPHILKKDRYIIHPDCQFKEIWDFLIFILLLYILIFNPILLAFESILNSTFCGINYFIDFVYFVDLVINFFVGFYDFEEELILTHKIIILHYLKTSFIADLISAIPIELIFLAISNCSTFNITNQIFDIIGPSKLFRIFIVLKIFKFFTVNKILFNRMIFIEDLSVESTKSRIFKFTIYFLLFSHISSCFWIFMSNLDFPNWIINSSIQDDLSYEIYISALYFTLTTIFTIGYGDVIGVSNFERLYNIYLMIVGIYLYSYTITAFSALLIFRDSKTTQYYSALDTLNEIDLEFRINSNLYERIKRFLTNDYKINRIEKNSVINILPTILKNKLTYEIYRVTLDNLKFFKNTTTEFKMRAVILLKKIKLYKGDYLIKENDFFEEIFFLMKGVLRIEKDLESGKLNILDILMYVHFGDVYMNMDIKSPFDIKVRTKTAELYIMKKNDYMTLSEEFPNIIQSIIRKAIKFMMKLEIRFGRRYKKLKLDIKNNEDLKLENKIEIVLKRKKDIENLKKSSKKLTEIQEEDETDNKLNQNNNFYTLKIADNFHSKHLITNHPSNSDKQSLEGFKLSKNNYTDATSQISLKKTDIFIDQDRKMNRNIYNNQSTTYDKLINLTFKEKKINNISTLNSFLQSSKLAQNKISSFNMGAKSTIDQTELVYNSIIKNMKSNVNYLKNPTNYIENNLNGFIKKALDSSEVNINEKLDKIMKMLESTLVKKTYSVHNSKDFK